MKVIIAGGRNFTDYDLLYRKCNNILLHQDWSLLEIVSGTANGADALGERYAKVNDVPIKRFPADWDNNGKAAGVIRNKQMAEYAEGLIAFWDGKSRGTKHMIDTATKLGLKVKIIKYEK